MKKTLLVALIALVNTLSAQIKMEGVVKDSVGNPLELANVIAINQQTNKLDSYAITDSKGHYQLNLNKDSGYKIQVSYIGMKTAEALINTKEEAIKMDFVLLDDASLKEVEIKYEMPVTIKGDTIVYNADSFLTGGEKKLEDVLKKMPGVEINDDGQIEVEGKKVTKVMVEGKEFFDGDSKLAAENIPSNAVDKVEVLRNYSEVGQLRGVTNNQDNVALNIKLKEGKKRFWFGDITAGAGAVQDDNLYLVQPKLFYYSPEYSINFIGDLNNIGEIAFTRRDYFNFTGGFRMPSRQSGTNIDLGNNSLSFLTMQNNRAKAINTKFGAANFSYSPKKSLDLSGFAIFSSTITDMQENNSITYTNSDLGIPDENTESITRQKSDLGMLKFSTKYTPDANNQLDYDILARTSRESQDQDFYSSINGTIGQLENSQPYSIKQDFDYYYTLNDKNIFAFEVQHFLQDENPFYNAIIEDKNAYSGTANDLGLNPDQSVYNVGQDKRVRSNQLDAKLDYWHVLNAKSNINFTLGTIYSKQNFNSRLFQFLDDNTEYNPASSINDGLDTNTIYYTFGDLYLGLHYRFKTGIFTITPGFSTHTYSTVNNQFGLSYKDNFFRILPDFNTIVQLKKTEQLIFNYRMQTQFTDVNQFAMGLVMNNYNSFFSGNPELTSAVSHNVNLSYFSFNMFNYTNVFANISYNKAIDQIRTASQFQPGSVIRISSPFNSGLADESFNANGRFEKRFRKIQARINGNFNYSKFNQFINDQRSVNESYSQTYGSQLRTNFKEAPNISLNYRFTIQNNNQGSTTTTYYTKAPSVEMDAYILKSLTFKSGFSYTNFSNKEGTLRDYKFWDASLNYRKKSDSKWEYELKATNLLDTKSQNNTSITDYSVRATEYFIQPRFITFRLRYNL
ncbi:MAG: carboxypeptidase-like regulatory domain-containing protein [Flavobacteriaceae bacterium]|nr:carboxypeptidase-like regulatory domain-containing protein [Flavobacteriaceae bacterium]